MTDLVCFRILETMLPEIFSKSIHALIIVELQEIQYIVSSTTEK